MVSSGYTGPISSGQVSVVTSGVSGSIAQTIPIRNSIVHTPPPMPTIENVNSNNIATSGESFVYFFLLLRKSDFLSFTIIIVIFFEGLKNKYHKWSRFNDRSV